MAPAEGLFTEFARTYEARKETDLSLSDYLEACRKDPMMYATAAERFIAAIGEPVLVDTAKDARLGRIFLNRTSRSTPPSPTSTAWRRRSSGSSASSATRRRGLEERKQILYLLGPVGGGKSSLAERLKPLMERQPIYVLKAGDQVSPVFESPLGLFDPDQMGPMLEDRYGIPRRRLTGLMRPGR